MAHIIDGKKISAEERAAISEKVSAFKDINGYAPGLAVIIVGSDPASQVYVRNKKRACEEVGIYSEVIEMPEDTKQSELEARIASLADDPRIHGILVQLPLPRHLDEARVIAAIPPERTLTHSALKMWDG